MESDSGVHIRGRRYRVQDLIDAPLPAEHFQKGVCLVFRLSPFIEIIRNNAYVRLWAMWAGATRVAPALIALYALIIPIDRKHVI